MTQDRPWTPQSAVAAAVARRLIESQFPDLAPARLAAGAGMVLLFFLLPRWLEKYDPWGVSRFFRHDAPGEE